MKLFQSIENKLVCILLIMIAIVQMYNSQFDSLTPWKGGGFGMFSTNKKKNITAIGYTSDGDSILINVAANKFDVPISKNFLKSTLNYPKDRKLHRLGELIVASYLKPDTIQITSKYLDNKSYQQIKTNPAFYTTIYRPQHYQSTAIAQSDKATRIQKVKLLLYETDFYEQDLLYKKTYFKEIEVSK